MLLTVYASQKPLTGPQEIGLAANTPMSYGSSVEYGAVHGTHGIEASVVTVGFM